MLKVLGEDSGGLEFGGEATVEFDADRVEIHEPALEQRPRHRLQRRVHPLVQLDLVVQRPKHPRDGFLLREGRVWNMNRLQEDNGCPMPGVPTVDAFFRSSWRPCADRKK